MNDILTILIIGLLLYLAFVSQYYLPSYFKKKGENLAQLQDIEELTRKVDSIKQDFIERTENLKAKLDFSTQLQMAHLNEERNAIMAFLRAFTNYYSICNDSAMGGINIYNTNELFAYRLKIDDAYNQMRITKAILKVFLDDPDFYELSRQINRELLKIELALKHHLIEIEYSNHDLERCKADIENVNQTARHAEILETRKKSAEKYRDTIRDLSDKFYQNITDFNKLLKKHLVKSTEGKE